MKIISRAALAAALALGTAATLAVPPALAKDDKKKAAEPAKPTYSQEFVKAAGPSDKAVAAKDYAALEAALPAAAAAARNDYDKFAVLNWQYALAQSKNDSAGMLAAVDGLIANPYTPAENLPRNYFNKGLLARDAKQPAVAIEALTKSMELGYKIPNAATPEDRQAIALQIAKLQIDSGQFVAGADMAIAAIDAEYAAGNKPPVAWYDYALANLVKGKDLTKAADVSLRRLRAYPGPDGWRNAIAVYVRTRTSIPKQERIDLRRLQRAIGALADQNDYDDYANDVQNSGLPWETKVVIDEGRANGKIPAGDTTANSLYASAQTAIKAEPPLATLEPKAAASPTGALSAQTGDAYLASANYPKAVTLYRAALAKGVANPDETNTRLGIALANSGDKAGAKEAFAKVGGARKDIAKFWLTWLETTTQ